jgi:hypothetical protein
MNDTHEKESESRRDAGAVVDAPLHGLLAEYDNPGVDLRIQEGARCRLREVKDTFTPSQCTASTARWASA